MRQLAPIALLALAELCCSTPGEPSSHTGRLHAELVDAVGDAKSDPLLSIAPDLVRATVDVADGNLTIIVWFAPFTFDPKSMGVEMYLDTDQDPGTGAPSHDGIRSGAEYLLHLSSQFGPVSVERYSGLHCPIICFTPTANTFVVVSDATSVRTTIPLSMLGSTDGHMTVQMHTVAVTPVTTFFTDYMPDVGLPPVRIE